MMRECRISNWENQNNFSFVFSLNTFTNTYSIVPVFIFKRIEYDEIVKVLMRLCGQRIKYLNVDSKHMKERI